MLVKVLAPKKIMGQGSKLLGRVQVPQILWVRAQKLMVMVFRDLKNYVTFWVPHWSLAAPLTKQ